MRVSVLLTATTTRKELDLSEGPRFGPGVGTITITGLPGTDKGIIAADDPRLVLHAYFRDASGYVLEWTKTHSGVATFTLTGQVADMTYWTEWGETWADFSVEMD